MSNRPALQMNDITYDVNTIKKLIPHRYPFLLVDKIVEFKKDVSVVAVKNVTANEEFFNGHFPHMPIMPGVLIVEALAQTSALFYLMNQGISQSDSSVLFMAIDKCKFRKPVVPGDTLLLNITPQATKNKVVKVNAKAYCGESLVCEATLTAMLTEK